MADDVPGPWPFWAPGAWLAGHIRRITIHCYTKTYKLCVFGVRDTRGMVSRNYKGDNAPVISIPGSLGAGDSGDIAEPRCRDLTFDESRQCRRCAGVFLISRQNANLCHINSYNKGGAQPVHLHSLISSCFVA